MLDLILILGIAGFIIGIATICWLMGIPVGTYNDTAEVKRLQKINDRIDDSMKY